MSACGLLHTAAGLVHVYDEELRVVFAKPAGHSGTLLVCACADGIMTLAPTPSNSPTATSERQLEYVSLLDMLTSKFRFQRVRSTAPNSSVIPKGPNGPEHRGW
jgi:hypothetical protein